MSVMVAQLGARMHYAVPRILERVGLLERLYTDICAQKGWPRWLRMVPSALRPALSSTPCYEKRPRDFQDGKVPFREAR